MSAVWDGNNGGPWNWGGGTTDNTTAADRVTSFSSRSPTLTDIFAPGAFITNAGLGGGTSSLAGTSQAAPQVAGIATVAQQLADATLGRRLTQAEFRDLMQSTGVTINDGDDEDDNVTNTGANYSRVDMWALMRGVLATAASGSQVYSPALSVGSNLITGLNFGNQLTSSPKVAAATGSISEPHNGTAGEDTFSITTATFADLSQTARPNLTQPAPAARTPLRAIPTETLVGQQPLSRLVDTVLTADASDFMVNDPIQSVTPTKSDSSLQVVDSLFAVVDHGWELDNEDQLVEHSDSVEDPEAVYWPADEIFNHWLG